MRWALCPTRTLCWIATDADELSWGDLYELPFSVHWLEMLVAVEGAAKTLRDDGVAFTKRCRTCVGDHDQDDASSSRFANSVKKQLKRLPAAARAELTWYLYSKS